jgi:hypothetical protein
VRAPAETKGREHIQPRHGGAERSRGGDLRRRRPLTEADPADAPPADKDVEGGDPQRPEHTVGVASHRRGRRKVAAGEVGRAHGEIPDEGVGERTRKSEELTAAVSSKSKVVRRMTRCHVTTVSCATVPLA